MRTAMIVISASLIVTIVDSASASPIVLDYGVYEYRRNALFPTTQRIVTHMATLPTGVWMGNPRVTQDAWTIPAVTSASVGHVFTLNAANAAASDVDWSLWQTAVHDLMSSGWTKGPWIIGFEFPDILDGYGDPTGIWHIPAPTIQWSIVRPVIDALDSVELTLEEFFTNPLGSIVRIHPRVYGEGQYVPVPEPACWFMLCVGLWHVAIRRRR